MDPAIDSVRERMTTTAKAMAKEFRLEKSFLFDAKEWKYMLVGTTAMLEDHSVLMLDRNALYQMDRQGKTLYMMGEDQKLYAVDLSSRDAKKTEVMNGDQIHMLKAAKEQIFAERR